MWWFRAASTIKDCTCGAPSDMIAFVCGNFEIFLLSFCQVSDDNFPRSIVWRLRRCLGVKGSTDRARAAMT